MLKKDTRIWDIFLFGSATRGKLQPRDLDAAVFFSSPVTIDEKLSISQKIREELGEEWRVIGIDINDLVDGNFVARTGIIAEGLSVRRGKRLSALLGFQPAALFTYSLGNLSNSERTRMKYALSGRGVSKGLLKKWGGRFLGKGCIVVPVDVMDEVKELFESFNVRFSAKKTLIQE